MLALTAAATTIPNRSIDNPTPLSKKKKPNPNLQYKKMASSSALLKNSKQPSATKLNTTISSNSSSFKRKQTQFNVQQLQKKLAQFDEDPWSISEEFYPKNGPLNLQLEFLLRYAILAPSNYNSQPWQFRIVGNSIEMYANKERELAIVDPVDRHLLISCGSAFFLLRLAASHFGFQYTYDILPDLSNLNLLARMTVTQHNESEEFNEPHQPLNGPSAEIASSPYIAGISSKTHSSSSFTLPKRPSFNSSNDDYMFHEVLFQSITSRKSERSTFDPKRSIDKNDLLFLQKVAEEEDSNVSLQTITDTTTKRQIASLIAHGDQIQTSYLPYRNEIAKWIRSNNAIARDGVPCSHFHISNWSYFFGSYKTDAAWGINAGQKNQEAAEGSPALLVLSTTMDSDREWFAAGQSLMRMWLAATSIGLSLSEMNQAVDLPDLRGQLQEIVLNHKQSVRNTSAEPTITNLQQNTEEDIGLPQIVLRVGYSRSSKNAAKATSRLPLHKVLLPSLESLATSLSSSALLKRAKSKKDMYSSVPPGSPISK